MDASPSSGVAGTQVVRRVGALLRAVASTRGEGARLADLAIATQLTKPTAHRLLTSLAAEGLLDQDASTGRWLLGPELYVMGAISSSRFAIEEIARPSLKRLAAATGETALLSIRRGSETLCLVREEGAFPIRSFVLMEGTRFPLGIGSAGIAILAFMEDQEREQYLNGFDPSPPEYGPGQSIAAIRASVAEARSMGYSVNPGRIVSGSWGMAAAILDAARRPMWALVLTGVEHRFGLDRRAGLGRLLMKEAHFLTRQVALGADLSRLPP